MGSLNTARAILVGGAVIATLIAGAYQHWTSVGILLVGLAAHGGLWLWLSRRPSGPPASGPPASGPAASNTPSGPLPSGPPGEPSPSPRGPDT